MSELLPKITEDPTLEVGASAEWRRWPRDTEELRAFFAYLAEKNPPEYQQLLDTVDDVARTIEMFMRASPGGQVSARLPLRPGGRDEPSAMTDLAPGSRVLMEAVYMMASDARLIVDETKGDALASGRVWWQGHYQGRVLNFIERRKRDDQGGYIDWGVVSEVPEDLYEKRNFHIVDLSLEQAKVIRSIQSLPETAFESPADTVG